MIEEVVTTGTPGGASIRKLDASFSITTLNDDEIARVSPVSTADLMKTIPGLWVESSGGVSGANIDVRGFPDGSDASFVTVSMNGMPVYPAPPLSFMENSSLFRVDETIGGAYVEMDLGNGCSFTDRFALTTDTLGYVPDSRAPPKRRVNENLI